MPNRQRQSLSTGDALFLYLEREGQPINVAAATVLEGRIRLETCRAFIESKLPGVPRYLQRVVTPPLNLGPPAWEDDPQFDIRNHVREVTLRHGTEAEFKAMAGKILTPLMDRRRPLWDVTLVHGLRGQRTGMVIRIHHCLADGVSGVGLLNAILDPKPVPAPRRQGRQLRPAQGSEPRGLSALDGVLESCLTIAQRAFTGGSELLSLTQEVLGTAHKAGQQPAPIQAAAGRSSSGPTTDELLQRVPEIANAAERLPFNVVCHGPQKCDWMEIPLADIKAVKQACGTTVNDVFLTVVTLAVRHYAALHKVPLQGRLLRIVAPVNARASGEVNELGNHITFLPLAVPLDIADPAKLLAAVHERVTFSRSMRLPELVSMFGTWLGTIPAALKAVLGPVASQLPLSICNMICTNVPGPQEALYLFGHKLLSCYPYVPIGGEMGMNCAVMTYNGTAFFGFLGDAHAVPDLERLERFVSESFEKLQEAAGVRAGRSKRSRVRPKPSPTRGSPARRPKGSPSSSQTSPRPAAVEPGEAAAEPKPTAALEAFSQRAGA
jgi:diacylglycerol O-acyltransferase